MHKQKTAEQERRSMRLLTTGEFEAAEKYFIGNAQALKRLEMVENSLRDNAKVVITEHGISPTLLLASLPVYLGAGNGNGKSVKLAKDE